MSSRKNRSPEEQARRAKIRELLELSDITSTNNAQWIQIQIMNIKKHEQKSKCNLLSCYVLRTAKSTSRTVLKGLNRGKLKEHILKTL